MLIKAATAHARFVQTVEQQTASLTFHNFKYFCDMV